MPHPFPVSVWIRCDVAPKSSPVCVLRGKRRKGGIDAPISEKAVIRETDDQGIRLYPVLKVGSKKGVYRILLSPVPEVIGKQCQGDCR